MYIISKIMGVLITLLFGFIFKESLQHENGFDEKFGEHPETEWSEDENCYVFKYPEREFRRQDEDMANTVVMVVSFICTLIGVYIILR